MEGTEGREGEEREEQSEWRGKISYAYILSTLSLSSVIDFHLLLSIYLFIHPSCPPSLLPYMYLPLTHFPPSVNPHSLLAISSSDGSTRSDGPTPMYKDCLTDISAMLAAKDTSMSERSVGSNSSLPSSEAELPPPLSDGLPSLYVSVAWGVGVEESGGMEFMERGSSGSTSVSSSAFS